MMNNELYHYGVKGMKWGVRRYQNKDGTRKNNSRTTTRNKSTVNAKKTSTRTNLKNTLKGVKDKAATAYKNRLIVKGEELYKNGVRVKSMKTMELEYAARQKKYIASNKKLVDELLKELGDDVVPQKHAANIEKIATNRATKLASEDYYKDLSNNAYVEAYLESKRRNN